MRRHVFENPMHEHLAGHRYVIEFLEGDHNQHITKMVRYRFLCGEVMRENPMYGLGALEGWGVGGNGIG